MQRFGRVLAVLALVVPSFAKRAEGQTALPGDDERSRDERASLDELGSRSWWQPGRARRAHSYVSVRGGGSSADQNGMPTVCAEVSPLRFVGMEGCGTGAGLWHEAAGREIAHFRLELTPLGTLLGPRLVLAGIALDPQIGVGFAELQLAKDDPGFRFGESAGQLDTSGPEATLSLRALAPLALGLELAAELAGAIAHFPHARELVTPKEELQPSLTFAVGLGF